MALNPRIQKFLDCYHQSFNSVEAYRAAGLTAGDGKTVLQSATSLLNVPAHRDYLLELNRIATMPESDRSKGAKIVAELTAIALSKITDICSWDNNGNVTFNPSHELTPAVAGAVETLRIESTQFGPKITVKMHSKQTALTTLARYYNVDVDMNSLLERVRSYDYEPIDMGAKAEED